MFNMTSCRAAMELPGKLFSQLFLVPALIGPASERLATTTLPTREVKANRRLR